ncbi:MAG: hypothetical protein Q4A72_02280 [Bacillota bacterium]|nr:hypothetical protein [Bacillota bacterium]
MWLFFGIAAILAALFNVLVSAKRRPNVWYGFASLSLSALTVCAFYQEAAEKVIHNDFAYLMDVMPTASKLLWACVIISILVNGSALISNKKN